MTGRVLVTGAAGGVAGLLLRGPLAKRSLRLVDRVPPPACDGAETAVGDLADAGFTAAVTGGVDAVVHLAANPHPDAPWQQLVAPNLTGLANLLAAAADHRVRRLVLASSVHAMGRYVRTGRLPVDPSWAPAPCCRYGSTKAFAETAARAHVYRHGTSAVCLRLGATTERPVRSGDVPCWLGPDDLCQLVECALDADVDFGVYHGVSANTRHEWDYANATRDLGYRPVLDSEPYAGSTVPADSLCPPLAGR